MIDISGGVVTVTYYRATGIEQRVYPTFAEAAGELMKEMDDA